MGEPAHSLFAHLVGAHTRTEPVPWTLLAALDGEPTRVRGLADAYDITRQQVYRAFEALTEHRAVRKEGQAYRRTGLGAVLARVIREECERPEVTRAALAFLAASEHRGWLLQQLRAEPATKAALADGEDRPSRTTVHRAIAAFVERGWVTTAADSSTYTVTATGERLAIAYASALTALEHALQRAPLLACCGETVADIPLAGLAAADQYVLRPATPDAPKEISCRLEPESLDTYRGFLSVVSREYAENGDAIIRSGADTELIITERVLYNLPTEGPYAAYVKRGLEATNLTLLVVPDIEVLPVGLSILDGERVIIAPANQGQVPSDGPAAEVMGDDPALVTWCQDLYETYRARARSPTKQVLADLKQRVAEAVPAVPSPGDE